MIQKQSLVSVFAFTFFLLASARLLAVDYDPALVKEHFPATSGAWAVVPPGELVAYDDVWILSDVHGQLGKLKLFLHDAGLIASTDEAAAWTGKNQLLVLVGDYIDGEAGKQGAQVLAFLDRLAKQAPGKASKVIALLGNHEAGLIADPGELRAETLTSFATFLNVQVSDLNEARIRNCAPVEFARKCPLAAILGNWFITHGGFLNTTKPNLKKYLGRLAEAWSGKPSEKEGFKKLAWKGDEKLPADKNAARDSDLGSLLSAHRWYEKNNAEVQEVLNSIGLGGMIVGHEPKLLKEGQAAINNAGWLMKVDAGLKKGNPGTLVHCSPKRVVPSLSLTLPFTSREGKAVCTQRLGNADQQEQRIPYVEE